MIDNVENSFQDISLLSEEEMFVEFYKNKLGKEPKPELVKLFMETLQEVRNASN